MRSPRNSGAYADSRCITAACTRWRTRTRAPLRARGSIRLNSGALTANGPAPARKSRGPSKRAVSSRASRLKAHYNRINKGGAGDEGGGPLRRSLRPDMRAGLGRTNPFLGRRRGRLALARPPPPRPRGGGIANPYRFCQLVASGPACRNSEMSRPDFDLYRARVTTAVAAPGVIVYGLGGPGALYVLLKMCLNYTFWCLR